MQKLKPAKIIKDHSKDIVGIDFSNDGQLLYTADNTMLNIYATRTGQNYRKLYLKNHEIEQISHTHHESAVLVATKKSHLILYWSIHENKIIKMFKGHTDTYLYIKFRITSLIMCPKDDSFLTTSSDNTMRLWNLNSTSQCNYYLIKNAISNSVWKNRACQLFQLQILIQLE
jgi:COMPASS component SWD2